MSTTQSKGEALKALTQKFFNKLVGAGLLREGEPKLLVEKYGLTVEKIAACIEQYAKKPYEDNVLGDYVSAETIRFGVIVASLIPKSPQEQAFKKRALNNLDRIQSQEWVDFFTETLNLACRILFGNAEHKKKE